MPIGSIDLDNLSPPLWDYALPIGVFRFDGAGGFSALPNVYCDRIDTHEGPDPSAARFSYLQGDALDASFGWPSRFDEIWPIDAQGPFVVLPDDRLVVAYANPDGSLGYLFDGFAQVPQVDVTPVEERVTFSAVGVAVRCWDRPIRGRVQRSAATPATADGSADVRVSLPARFNPSSQGPASSCGIAGNSTSDAYYTNGVYPVFLDQGVEEYDEANDTNYVSPWWISDALLYLLNCEVGDSANYVQWPTYSTLESLLVTYYPPSGSAVLNAATAVTADVMIRDYSAAGKMLPDVVSDLLGYAGYVMSWQLAADGNGLPQTYLNVYRRDAFAAAAPKLVYLDVVGNAVSPAADNLKQISLSRDLNHVVNAYHVETRPKQYEITVTLAPYTWEPATGDNLAANRRQFFASSFTATTPASVRRKYRWYTADECGDGHYNADAAQTVYTACSFSPVFPARPDGSPSWVSRYRPGGHRAIAVDTEGHPLHAVLEISFGAGRDRPGRRDRDQLGDVVPGHVGLAAASGPAGHRGHGRGSRELERGQVLRRHPRGHLASGAAHRQRIHPPAHDRRRGR